MSELDHSFAKLLGRQPSDTERQNLYHVRDALDLKNNDALWLVLMALEHYKTQYIKFPSMIAQAASETLDNIKKTADATLKASSEATKRDLTQAVEKTAKDIARNTSRKQMLQWTLGCLICVAIILGAVFWYAHSSGQNAGYAQGYGEGYAKAQDEKAAASWANTPEGKLAYRLTQAGDIRDLAACTKTGWVIDKNGLCIVQAKDGYIHGWRTR
jgi:hypothetical protein